MQITAPITEIELEQLATDWYAHLDAHAPGEEFRGLLAGDKLRLQYPEGTFTGFDGFLCWYEQVIRLFFDEAHTLKEVRLLRETEHPKPVSTARVVVHWQASRWLPPAPRSERIDLDSYHTWTIQRSPATGRAVILTYIVEHIEYAKGSVTL